MAVDRSSSFGGRNKALPAGVIREVAGKGGSLLKTNPDGLTPLLARARDAAGRYRSIQVDIIKAHQKMAELVADRAAEELETRVERRGRPQRESTSLLAEVIRNEKNRDANPDGFVVGTDYLNEGPTRFYWRGLEKGTDVHEGREISGFFKGPGEYWYGPSSTRLNTRLIQLGPVFGENGRQTTIRVGASGSSSQPGQEGRVVNTIGPWTFTINRPIPAYRYFQVASDWFNVERANQVYRDVLSHRYPELFP